MLSVIRDVSIYVYLTDREGIVCLLSIGKPRAQSLTCHWSLHFPLLGNVFIIYSSFLFTKAVVDYLHVNFTVAYLCIIYSLKFYVGFPIILLLVKRICFFESCRTMTDTLDTISRHLQGHQGFTNLVSINKFLAKKQKSWSSILLVLHVLTCSSRTYGLHRVSPLQVITLASATLLIIIFFL